MNQEATDAVSHNPYLDAQRDRVMKSDDTRVRRIADTILESFRSGSLPNALAYVMLDCSYPEGSPVNHWSLSNRLLVALAGQRDARGFKQWLAAGRCVKKGSKAFHILGPRTVRRQDEDPVSGEEIERTKVIGYFPIAVFGLSQTEGEPIDLPETIFLDSLPLIEVARDWGINVVGLPGDGRLVSGAAGYYLETPCGKTIALAVENLATWAHELVHAADARLGTLTRKRGQQVDNEIVAELGGAILLSCLGRDHDADIGGAWAYIQKYAGKPSQALSVCLGLIERTCAAVAVILEAANIGVSKEALRS